MEINKYEDVGDVAYENLWLYALAVGALITGIVLTFIMATVRPRGLVLLSIALLIFVFAALSGYLSGSYVLSMFLGLLPLYGAGIGEVIGAPYDGSLLAGIANFLLLLSAWGLIVGTFGFLLGIVVRYRGQLSEQTQWIAVRVGISAATLLALYLAARNNWISFGVTPT